MPMVKKPASQVNTPPAVVTETAPNVPLLVGVFPQETPTKYGKPLGRYELETDRRIHISGIMQAVAASPALVPFILKREDYSKVVVEETKNLLKAAQEIIEKGA